MTQISEAPRRIAVVMAGGRGTRFWPRSRTLRPKQFLTMVGDRTLLEQTIDRLKPAFQMEDVYIVTTEDLAAETQRMLPGLPAENVLVEPEGRNTAPCLALALVEIERRVPQGVMAVLSADHWIADAKVFLDDLQVAMAHAQASHALMTFGIRPTHPETGYGYIETEGQGQVLKVTAFREKPPLDTAMAYVASGRHYWNAGMFVWALTDFRRELLEHCPEVLRPLDAWVQGGASRGTLKATYAQLPRLSIDYALMEKSKNVAVVSARFPWSDVGSWPAASEFLTSDAQGNAAQGEALWVDTRRCTLFGGNRLVAFAGVEDLIVVDEPDALLVCHRDRAQDVKMVVDRLQALGRQDLL